MNDKQKTKAQLIQELETLRRTIVDLKKTTTPNPPRPESELALQNMINNLLSGMVYQVIRKKDGTRVFTYLSDTVRRFYGIAPEEGLANAALIYGRINEEDRLRVFREEERAHRSLSPFRSEVRMVGPQGELRWSLFVSHPRRLADGSTCWDGIEFDITERKNAEEALRESEEKFSQIFRTIPDAVAIARLSDGVYIDVNEGYTKVSGYSREELIGHSPLPGDLNLWVRREDREPFAAALKSTGQALGFEIQFRHKNGTIRKAMLSARVLDVQGDRCHVAIITDITERKRIEEELQKSEEKFRTIFENNSSATALIEPDSTFSMVNDAYCRMTGYTRKELVGMNWTRVVAPKDLERIKAYFRGLTVNPRDAPALYEFTFLRKDGSIRQGLVSPSIIPGSRQLISSVSDISGLKETERALQESQDRLRALSARLQSVREEERSSMSREIHDDLGQLLTGLKMDLSWILLHPEPDLAALKEKARAMGQVIDQMVQTVRRISTELRPRILDDFGLVAALEWQAEEFSKKTGIDCRFRANGQRRGLKPDLSIAVFRIFQETLTNVARHSGATRVEASLKQNARGLVLEIRDYGRGISEKEALGSKSLGLVGMRERALIFGGQVEITGKKGKGTTVILHLPVSDREGLGRGL